MEARRAMGHSIGVILLLVLLPATSLGFVSLAGDLTLSRRCQATVSLHHRLHPVTLMPGATYRVLGRNAPDGAFVQLQVPHADPPQRWIPLACGQLRVTDTPSPDGPAVPFPHYVLAISWQPAVCHNQRRKPECRTQTPDRFDASHFTLHGLWPAGLAYCNVTSDLKQRDQNQQWAALPEPLLTEATWQALQRVMPGTQSHLHRHQWIKHGTCDGRGSEAYFATSIALLDQVNGSSFREFFVQRIGQHVTRDAVRAAFAQAFGPAARNKLVLTCNKGLIEELRITLRAPIPPGASLPSLFDAAHTVSATGCAQGRIDAVGF